MNKTASCCTYAVKVAQGGDGGAGEEILISLLIYIRLPSRRMEMEICTDPGSPTQVYKNSSYHRQRNQYKRLITNAHIS